MNVSLNSTGEQSQPFETTAIELDELNQAFNASHFTEHDPMEHLGDDAPVEKVLEGAEYDSVRATIANRIERPVTVPIEAVESANDNRPHNKLEDSANSITGSRQATTSQLLSLKSISWAEKMVGFKVENTSHTRTAVSKIHSKDPKSKYPINMIFSATILHHAVTRTVCGSWNC